MTLRRSGGTGDTSSWPTGLLANPAPCAGPPWPESITYSLISGSEPDCASHILARSLLLQPELKAIQARIVVRRNRVKTKQDVHPREITVFLKNWSAKRHSQSFCPMRASSAVFEAPEKTVELVPRMFQLHKHSLRENVGCKIRLECRYECSGLCSPAKGDPRGMGHHFHFVKVVGREMVSLPRARPAQGHSIGNAKRFLPL